MTPSRQGTVGVTIGKFNPPHVGHRDLIEQAAKQVDRLCVVLCDRSGQTFSAERRRAWHQDASPENAKVLITPDNLPEESEPNRAKCTGDCLS